MEAPNPERRAMCQALTTHSTAPTTENPRAGENRQKATNNSQNKVGPGAAAVRRVDATLEESAATLQHAHEHQ